MRRLQELMTTSTEPEMIESEIYGTVLDAVKEELIGTNLLALRIGADSIPGSSIDVDMQTKDNMDIMELGEGQEVPISLDAVSSFNLKPKKYGVRPLITKEMIEDNKFDIVQRNLAEAGYQMAKKLDSLLMAQIEAGSAANSTTHTVTGGSAAVISNITSSLNFLEADGHHGTDMIVSAEFASDLRNIDTFVEADKAGISNPGMGLIGTIFGMKVWQTNQVTAKYAYIIDRRYALVLAEKRPITVANYDDVARDLTGVVITARWVARYLYKEACSVITTT